MRLAFSTSGISAALNFGTVLPEMKKMIVLYVGRAYFQTMKLCVSISDT